MSQATPTSYCLYIFQLWEYCKIGITNRGAERRARGIQTPIPLTVYCTFPFKDEKAARLAETLSHAILHSLHSYGEWFKIDPLDACLLIEHRLHKHFKRVDGVWDRDGARSMVPKDLRLITRQRLNDAQRFDDPAVCERRRAASKTMQAALYADAAQHSKRDEAIRSIQCDPAIREQVQQARKAGNKCDLMRALVAKHGDTTTEAREAIFTEFEEAGLRGEIQRGSNSKDQSWRLYARFLYNDGKRRGWLYRNPKESVEARSNRAVKQRRMEACEAGNKRELIRALYAKHGDATFEARQAICDEFEQAGLRGEIATASPDVNWRHLARQLLRHGKNEGWLHSLDAGKHAAKYFPSWTIHILDARNRFRGQRGRVWKLIREGMTVQALVDACEGARLDARANLKHFTTVYHCIEVRKA